MKSTRTHSAPTSTAKLTEQVLAELEAEYRTKYKKEAAEYRAKFGEEPSLGTLIGAEVRAECNNMTREEARAGALSFMRRFYGQAAANPTHEPAAVRR